MTKRDLRVALVTAAATAAAMTGLALTGSVVTHSTVFDWRAMVAHKTDVGEVRQVMRAPTPTLDELEIHVTTLNPGEAPHPPHRHPNEELVIVRQGTVEAYENGVWTRVGPGSVIFSASNELHGLRNVGTTPAIYHVINWRTGKTPPQ